jgi:hypothetical protein
MNNEEVNRYGGEDLKMITKTVVRTKLSILIDGQDLFFMNILLLFEKMEKLFIRIGSTGLNQCDKKKFKEFVQKGLIDGDFGFDAY